MIETPLSKLTIRAETRPGEPDQVITAQFNPKQVGLQRSATWQGVNTGKDTKPLQFVSSEPAILTLDLFFDKYADADQDVIADTEKIFHLTTVQQHGDLHRPPLCKLNWGEYHFINDSQWVLQDLRQTFTLFRSNGKPVRATLSCTFRQWRGDDLETKLTDQKSPDVAKSRVVQRGETLSGIAAEEYLDPGLWRPIAEANGIDNPYRLEPGQVLAIPVLRPGRGERR